MKCEAETKADFTQIRYAQCWEDADVLLEGLHVQPGDICFSVASAGDNTLAMLARAPERVVAVDLNPAQLACLQLRVAAYRELKHTELLELIGSRPSARRETLYRRCRTQLTHEVREFWDRQPVELGIGSLGKFERYFETFRNRVLPLVHSRRMIERLLAGGTRRERDRFYDEEWNSWRWRLMFKLFFSRAVMGRMGRDPSFFKYVEGTVAGRILERSRHALTALDTSSNPYLHWILTGRHNHALPFALRAENFEAIRNYLDRLEWHCCSVEEFFAQEQGVRFDRFNLSDIFEYMSAENYERLLEEIAARGRPGARLLYWNTLAPRSRPERLSERLIAKEDLSRELHARDKAFFYCRLVIEEVCSGTPMESQGPETADACQAVVGITESL